MRRIVLIAMTSCLSLGLASCGETSAPSPSPSPSASIDFPAPTDTASDIATDVPTDASPTPDAPIQHGGGGVQHDRINNPPTNPV